MDQEIIGKFIAQKRKEKHLTQQQLADQLHLSVNAISKWERGINMCDVSIMKELCQILGITLRNNAKNSPTSIGGEINLQFASKYNC